MARTPSLPGQKRRGMRVKNAKGANLQKGLVSPTIPKKKRRKRGNTIITENRRGKKCGSADKDDRRSLNRAV